jgi:hypothetical protein
MPQPSARKYVSLDDSFLLEKLSYVQQLRPALLADPRILKLHLRQALIDQEGNQQAAVRLLVGGYDVPRGPRRTGVIEAVLVRFHVLIP